MADREQGETKSNGISDDAADRAAFLAEMRKPAAKEKPAEVEETEEVETDAGDGADEEEAVDEASEETDAEAGEVEASDESGDVSEDEEEAVDEASEETDAESDESDEAKSDEKADADTKRRLDTVQKAERRSKEQLDREKKAAHAEIAATVAKLEAEWKPKIEGAEKFERMKSRVRSHTVDVLRELGATEDDFEHMAQQVFAHSKAASVKPEHRAAAARAALEREQALSLEATNKKIADLETMISQRDKADADRAAADRYFSQVKKALDPKKSPLAARNYAKNAERTRDKMSAIAIDLIKENGTAPSPAEVIAAYEKIRRAELEEDGVDVDALLKLAPAKKKAAIEVVDTKGKANPKPNGKPNGKRTEPLTDEEEREQILRELREQRAKSD
jgi:hypothetical protein